MQRLTMAILSVLTAPAMPWAAAQPAHAAPAAVLRKAPAPLSITVEESIGVGDTSSTALPLAVTVGENLWVGDSTTALAHLSVVVSEEVGIAQTGVASLLPAVAVEETVGVEVAPVAGSPLPVGISESVGIGDAPNAGAPLPVQVSDGVGVTDRPAMSTPLEVMLKQAVGVADASSAREPTALTVADAVGIGDGAAGLVTTPGRVQFSLPSYTVRENAGAITITVARTGGSDGVVSVLFKTQGGTATAGQDYTPVSGEISWKDGETGEKSFTITVVDDKVFQGDKTVVVRLSSTSHGAGLSLPISTTLTVQDNERVLTVGLTGTGIGVINGLPESVICLGQCTVAYEEGAIVTLTAAPLLGTTFAGWSGACSGTDPCMVTMTEATSVMASFSAPAIPATSLPVLAFAAAVLALAVTVTWRRRNSEG